MRLSIPKWLPFFWVLVPLANATVTPLYNVHRNQSLYSKTYAKYPGDIYLAGLFSINRLGDDKTCSEIIEQDGLQVLSAAIYGIKLVNNMRILPISLGLLAVDTCQNVDYVVEQSVEFMQFKIMDVQKSYSCSNEEIPKLKEELESFRNIFGVFGAGNSDVSIAVSSYLKLIKLPQLSYFSTNPSLSSFDNATSFFRTIPSDIYMTQAIIKLLKRYQWFHVMIVNDLSDYSSEITKRFKLQIQHYDNSEICVADTITILEKNNKNFSATVNKIIKANEKKASTIILTFLNQPVAENFVNYVSRNPNEELSKFLWIATDSWGGRDWPYLSSTNSILNNTIAVIPKAFNNSDFMDHYRSRLPSKIDCDPWLARTFEIKCRCQYKDGSLFIAPELMKLRKPDLNASSCEQIEVQCRNKIDKDLNQMLYIHYVIDGILAYGYTLQQLIPTNCARNSSRDCVKFLFDSGTLDLHNITRVMKYINFTDSTGEPFEFHGNSGKPKYSIVHFNQTMKRWVIRGDILENLDLSIETSFDQQLKENFNFPLCDKVCSKRQARSTIINCCWTCTICKDNEIVVDLNSSDIDNFHPLVLPQICNQCNKGQEVFLLNNTCTNSQEMFISFSDGIAVSIIIINMFGLLCSLMSCIIMILYWRTPIIKALGRETSTIILIGTMLSFSLSIALLDKPNDTLCYLRLFAPGFCSTLVYAAILTKTNRIARIFGMKLSSKKNTMPRFISPISQINIVLLITLVECVILAVVISTSDVQATYPFQRTGRVWDCLDIISSSLISIWLIPFFLLLCSTVYAFKIRKTPDGFNETRNLNFLNFTNCIVFVVCMLLHQVLIKDQYTALPFALMLTLGAHGNLIALFYPKIYITVFRPSKNTNQAILTKTRSFSQVTLSSSNFETPDSKLKDIKCPRCDLPMMSSVEMQTLSREYLEEERLRSKSKVQFEINPTQRNPPNKIDHGIVNRSFEDD